MEGIQKWLNGKKTWIGALLLGAAAAASVFGITVPPLIYSGLGMAFWGLGGKADKLLAFLQSLQDPDAGA